ncbi:MAG: M23 family metallopeptidase [Spirochaetales bacterium]
MTRDRIRTAVLLIALLTAVAAVSLPAQEELVTVYGETRDDGTVVIRASSAHIIPVYLNVDVPRLVGMESNVELPFGIELAPGTVGRELFELSPTRTSGRIGYGLQYSFARGNPATASHDDEFRYLIPFAHGDKRRLSQGFGGRFSHYGENEYAVDFEMPEGTPVYAARDGLVAEVKEDSQVGGPSVSYSDDGNFILVMHADGSFANYVHLRYGGAVVEPGDRVREGDLIGYSGNTGRSSGPHLHFDVRLPAPDGTMQSIPFLFRGRDGVAVVPEEGRFYYAHHPGGEPFEEVFGRDLALSDFAGYAEPFTAAEGVEIRVEQVDLTFLVFVQNGLDRESNVEIRFQLRGLSSDNGTRITRVVPARTEVLATILRPIAGATSIRYGYSVRYR